jgi:RNA polymerase sigma factor (sigma-70 family)
LERFATRAGEAAELAFAVLVERHGPMVLRACRGILRDDHEAHDAFQATFLILARKGRSLWVRDSLGPWLHRVACRAAGKARARAARQRVLQKQLTERLSWREDPGPPEPDERAAILHEEIDRLPERFRVPIILCHLDGRTCEDAARHLGCPVGTVASRLARGRQQLRDRLVRRGLAPGVVALLATSLTAGARAAPGDASSSLGLGIAGASPDALRLARAVLRSLVMDRVRPLATALLAAIGLTLAVGLTYRTRAANPPVPPARATSQPDDAPPREPLAAGLPVPPARATPKPDDAPPGKEPSRYQDFVIATVGNMRPLIEVDGRPSFQGREAILYQDGTARIWKIQKDQPAVAVLRHKGPIREIAFLDEAGVLITTSDDSVKIWDGPTGKLRKEIEGQVMRPLFLLQGVSSRRIATIDPAGNTVTLWDLGRLEPVGTLRPGGVVRFLGAALSDDERTLATIGEDRSVTLWDAAAQKPLATLWPPSPPATRVFPDDLKTSDKPMVKLDDPFWESVRSLVPAAPKAEAERPKS